ncbi:MAG: (2Fe-2S)-binding protein [Planctomycetes bacterium]|nr:(2Fe-2S)-binding protein [Planctomycetota bacterium]
MGPAARLRLTVTGQGAAPASVGQTVLEAALDAGLQLPFGCQRAECGVCRIQAEAGLEAPGRLEALTLRAFGCPPGVRLACQARLAADATVRRLPSDS